MIAAAVFLWEIPGTNFVEAKHIIYMYNIFLKSIFHLDYNSNRVTTKHKFYLGLDSSWPQVDLELDSPPAQGLYGKGTW
jgi:hypothetical protein